MEKKLVEIDGKSGEEWIKFIRVGVVMGMNEEEERIIEIIRKNGKVMRDEWIDIEEKENLKYLIEVIVEWERIKR